MSAMTVPAGRVRVGDDLLFLGKPHRITEILPYPRNRQFDAPKWRIARDAYGWEITLIPGQHHDVVRA